MVEKTTSMKDPVFQNNSQENNINKNECEVMLYICGPITFFYPIDLHDDMYLSMQGLNLGICGKFSSIKVHLNLCQGSLSTYA